jgi:hypothetical protein
LLNTVASAAGILFSLVDAPKSPRVQEQQNREAERNTARSNAEGENSAEFASHIAQLAQERQNRENEQPARDRQREIDRER